MLRTVWVWNQILSEVAFYDIFSDFFIPSTISKNVLFILPEVTILLQQIPKNIRNYVFFSQLPTVQKNIILPSMTNKQVFAPSYFVKALGRSFKSRSESIRLIKNHKSLLLLSIQTIYKWSKKEVSADCRPSNETSNRFWANSQLPITYHSGLSIYDDNMYFADVMLCVLAST